MRDSAYNPQEFCSGCPTPKYIIGEPFYTFLSPPSILCFNNITKKTKSYVKVTKCIFYHFTPLSGSSFCTIRESGTLSSEKLCDPQMPMPDTFGICSLNQPSNSPGFLGAQVNHRRCMDVFETDQALCIC